MEKARKADITNLLRAGGTSAKLVDYLPSQHFLLTLLKLKKRALRWSTKLQLTFSLKRLLSKF